MKKKGGAMITISVEQVEKRKRAIAAGDNNKDSARVFIIDFLAHGELARAIRVAKDVGLLSEVPHEYLRAVLSEFTKASAKEQDLIIARDILRVLGDRRRAEDIEERLEGLARR